MTLRVTFFTGHEENLLEEVLRLRTSIFVEHCGWPLHVEDGREFDQYDREDTIYAGVRRDDKLRGTFRATRTDRPYLAAEVFPHLATFSPYPRRADVWEISRFGVLAQGDDPALARLAYAAMFWFARRVGATALVAIADLPYERFLKGLGIRTRRYGPPQAIGTDLRGRTLRAVAGEIPVAVQPPATLSALLSPLQTVEITDASEIFGPARVSA